MGPKINTKNRFICHIFQRDLEAQWLCGCDVKEIKNNNQNIFSWPLRRQWSVGWDNDRRFDSRRESDLRTLWLHEASAATAIVSFPSTPYLIEQRPVTHTNLHGHMTVCVFYVSTRFINAHFTQTLWHVHNVLGSTSRSIALCPRTSSLRVLLQCLHIIRNIYSACWQHPNCA